MLFQHGYASFTDLGRPGHLAWSSPATARDAAAGRAASEDPIWRAGSSAFPHLRYTEAP
jgi:hypothetical protein